MKTRFLLRRKDNKVVLLNSPCWECLAHFVDELKHLNPKMVNKNDYEIVTIYEHLMELQNEV